MATKRTSISKKTRFEVYKRDSFRCQYCGASAPEAVLVIDHIDPLSKDGADEVMNYITACQPCNAGKSDRKLSDNTVIQKQKSALDDLNERREQLEMMLQWRNGLQEISEVELDAIAQAWSIAAPGYSLNESGLNTVRKMLKKYGVEKILDAIGDAHTTYINITEGKATEDSVHFAWAKVGAFLRISGLQEDEKRLYYIKGILKKRMLYLPPDVMKYLQSALKADVPVEDIEYESKHSRSWTAFRNWLFAEMEARNGQV